MTPRIVAMTAQENMSLKNFYKNDTYLHFSRIPVYGDSPEYITGYILLSDALEGLADDEFDKRLVELKRPISFFTEEDSCGHIWEELLKKHEQIGLIIDEYGCFQGIITLEDIIETILGLEVIDENDQATDMQQLRVSVGSVVRSASAPLSFLRRMTKAKLDSVRNRLAIATF